MKIKILIPVYNDWQSVFKLLDDINNQPITRDSEISVIIVNDASTLIEQKKMILLIILIQ